MKIVVVSLGEGPLVFRAPLESGSERGQGCLIGAWALRGRCSAKRSCEGRKGGLDGGGGVVRFYVLGRGEAQGVGGGVCG